MNDQTTPAPATTAPERTSPKKIIKLGIAVLVLAGALSVGVYFWHQSQRFVSTDNAYVNANRIELAAQVSGPVIAIHIQDQQPVKKGDVLIEIDPQPYQLAVDAAEAQLDLAYQSTSQDKAAVAAARATITQRTAELTNAQANEKRAKELTAQKLISSQVADTAMTEARTAEAAVSAAQANLQQALSALGKAGANNATVRAAGAKLAQARLDLAHTRVTAPADGLVANFELRPGSMVQVGTPIFTIIGDAEYWVDANFKETELARIQPGQKATVIVDMYKHHEFKGEVQSLAGGAGQAFSLLPAQNATGNWVKVTQRVPVRVSIVDPDPKFPLRIGTTATVRVAAPE
ncbi:MAG TPA: HlyD family secretion protein [Steroidobacteraceae bacterium]|nr:HlyD family secretion protein [Steroidobacteraceae bacterium]